MRITWLGHACFLLEEDGYRIVTDPYTGVEGYPPLEAEAHAVYCSHHHFDHDAVDCVRLLPARESPFHVWEIQAFHDDQKGALRGPNTIRVFTAGGVSVVHLGDLGHALSAEQLAAIGPVDGVLVPVGGVYTVDAQGAKAACDAIGPTAVDHLLVTRHLVRSGQEPFRGMGELSALCTEVLGRTGMETCELIRAAAGAVRPAAVVAVDALAARSPRRLCRTVQLSDTGLIPGSGVGSHRTAVDRETVGVPVIAVGVPTVIDGAALGSGTEAAPQGLYVTPRDIDRQVRQLGRLLGYGISLALQPGLTAEELAALAE